MAHRWSLRCPPPDGLVVPVPVDPTGMRGPTAGQARGPGWRRTSRGRFVAAGVGCRVEQRILEAALRLPSGGAVSGWAALRLFGGNFFDGLGPGGRAELPVPLVVPHGTNLRATAETRVHRRAYSPADVVERHGIPCLAPALALFDAIRWTRDPREQVVAIDMATSAGLVSLTTFRTLLAGMSRHPGKEAALHAVALASNRSKSPPESRMRLVWVLDAGLPTPRCNWPVADPSGVRIGRPDLLCETLGVVGEFDGAGHRDEEVRGVDFGKEDRYRDVGLESLRLIGRDLHDIAGTVRRMHAAVRRAAEAQRPRRWLLAADPGPL